MSKSENYRVRDKLTKQQILTIPNILSFFRLALIPVIVWLYVFKNSPEWTIAVLIVSGATDIIDGFIARHFNMTSDFGKAIDPLADKLTQIAVLFCLLTRFPLILLPIVIMLIKEIGSFILRFIVYKKTEKVESASWHGKMTTVLIYLTMLLHILWPFFKLPGEVSTISIMITAGMMIISCILYSIGGAKILIDHKLNKK
jgi:cardiolipin synthase